MLESLLASAWYPFELGKRLDQAIVDELGGDVCRYRLRWS